MSEVEVFESGVELRSKVGINIAEKSAAIRNIAEMLRVDTFSRKICTWA